jgi:hypothetical protein
MQKQSEREREIDSPTFGRSFVQVALEHQSHIIPPNPLYLFFIPNNSPLHSTCDHSLRTSSPQPYTTMGFDFLKPPSTTNSKPSPPPLTGPDPPSPFTSNPVTFSKKLTLRSLTFRSINYPTLPDSPQTLPHFSVFVFRNNKKLLSCHAQCHGISSTTVNCYSRIKCFYP